MFAERVVDSAKEAIPEPGVVFGSKVGRVIWEFLCGGWGQKDLGRPSAENGEELWAGVGWEGDVGYRWGVSLSG
jgi:hypothetical protein